ncbi:hypothetical protein ACS0TY_028510 [Phlomoides rotata]
MVSPALYFFLVLIIYPTTGAEPPAYTPTDLILLNCGDSSNVNDVSNRTWNGDDGSTYAPPNAAAISTASAASLVDPSVFPVPYERARVFRSSFTYTFPLLSGQKFLRLYFFPGDYSDFDSSQSFFNVTANGFTLLANFSAFIYSKNSSQPSFMKEFIINIGDNQKLELTFSPIPNSSAFVNGIEIVSIPDKLYFKGNDVPIKFVNQLFYLDNSIALENIYRLNVGGNRVEIQDDSGMFRAWNRDDDYIYGGDPGWTPHASNIRIKYTDETPSYSAPEIVYTTCRVMANYSRSLDWYFPVDSGFYYLLRLHFCEFFLEVTEQNERVFTISVNNQIEEIQADVIFRTDGTEIPIFRDYIAYVPNKGRRGMQDLWLSLFPDLEGQPKYSNALLNGLEIFKLSDENRSFAAPNPEFVTEAAPEQRKLPGEKKGGGSPVTYAVVGSVICALLVVGFLIIWWRRKVKDSATASVDNSLGIPLSIISRSTMRTSVSLPSDLCRFFTLDEIKAATHNFDDSSVIGRGGFGNVHKGLIDGGATTVAIKRLNSTSNQGAREFLTEIEMLSKLRHLHLVSLIGYCDEHGEMILVYDYMAHGTLRCHLYNSDNSPLTWKERLRICLGAARGLHYLHTGAKHTIIHRDVKSTNILLDEKFVAKMSDFGLSKVGPTAGTHGHVSTVVKGSFGYIDPEYYKRKQLTNKSDVYSFGVVLLEVLCARPPIISSLPRDEINLAEWAIFSYRKGTLEQIIDTNLDGQIALESLNKYVKTAVACLREKGVDRPPMGDVVWSLEFAMQLQETAESRGGNMVDDGDCDSFVALSASRQLLGIVEPSTTDEDMFSRFGEADGSKTSGLSTSSSEIVKAGDVFSELMNPIGR